MTKDHVTTQLFIEDLGKVTGGANKPGAIIHPPTVMAGEGGGFPPIKFPPIKQPITQMVGEGWGKPPGLLPLNKK